MSLENSMFSKKKRDAFYRLFFSKENTDFSLVDFLNDSSCDEIADIDLNHDLFKQISHREGKYFVPVLDSASYRSLYSFTRRYIVHPDDVASYDDLMDPDHIEERIANSELPHFRYGQFRYKLQSGEYRYVEQCLVTGKENGLDKGIIRLYVFDAENRFKRDANTSYDDVTPVNDRDTLTGLLESKSFFRQAKRIVNNSPNQEWCIASIDISKFTILTQWYGQDVGNRLLSDIGHILLELEKRYHGVSGYFGLDNFSILLPFINNLFTVLFDEIKEQISKTSSSSAFLPAIGVAKLEKNEDIFDAFDHSNTATNHAKKSLRDRVCIYGPELQSGLEKEMQILTDFMQALKNNEITFYLQPQCRISSKSIVGAEALARWVKPNGEIVSPGVFVPLLEKHGFVIDLDKYLWEKVCAIQHSFIKKGYYTVPISINISQVDIFSVNLVDHFLELTKKYDIPPSLIKLEITESAYAESTSIIADLVDKLKEKGFMVLMDDFGSGYSSLNMLSSLQVDAIKLDAMFLRMDEDYLDKGIHILESVVNMAKIISLPIVVEGVENKKQCDFLEGLGCRYIQGYYFYKPMPIADYEKLIKDPKNIDDRGFVVKRNEQLRIREFLDKNIYSDNMLNNIIGPVAFYSLKDGHVDIERFNEQFYEILDMPEMDTRLINIEQYAADGEQEHFLELFKQAMDDKLNGSVGFTLFKSPKGAIISLMMHLYYLGEKEGKKRFYGSVSNSSELMETKQQLSLISSFSSETIIFLRKYNEDWLFAVSSYSLGGDLQLNKEEFQDLFDKKQIYKLFASRTYFDSLYKKTSSMVKENQTFSLTLKLLNRYREIVAVNVKFTPVPDQSKNIKYIIQIVSR